MLVDRQVMDGVSTRDRNLKDKQQKLKTSRIIELISSCNNMSFRRRSFRLNADSPSPIRIAASFRSILIYIIACDAFGAIPSFKPYRIPSIRALLTGNQNVDNQMHENDLKISCDRSRILAMLVIIWWNDTKLKMQIYISVLCYHWFGQQFLSPVQC